MSTLRIDATLDQAVDKEQGDKKQRLSSSVMWRDRPDLTGAQHKTPAPRFGPSEASSGRIRIDTSALFKAGGGWKAAAGLWTVMVDHRG